MNYRLRELQDRIISKEIEINKLKEMNRLIEDIKLKLNDLSLRESKVDSYIAVCKQILLKAKEEEATYKTERVSYLKNIIENNLLFLFPDAKYEAELLSGVTRNKSKVSLKLKKEGDVKFRNPANSNGGMAQQVISFSSSFGIIKLLGKNKFYVDEALGNGSPEKKEKMAKIIDEYSKDNQIIMITQGSDLYSNIARREIRLKNDNNECKVVSIDDIGVDDIGD